MRAMVDSDVRDGMPLDSAAWTGPSRAPLLTRKRKEMKTTAANTTTSASPNDRSWWKMTAQGYRKTISMSKMMKIMAIR